MCSPYARRSRRLLAGAALAGFLALTTAARPVAAAVEPARLTIKRDDAGGVLTLSWAQPVTIATTEDGAEVALRFSRPLGAAPLDRIPERLAGLVDNILYGHDSLLVLVNPDVKVSVWRGPLGVSLTFRPKRKGPGVADGADARTAQARLEYLGAVVDMERGRVKKARATLNELVQRDPRDVQAVQLLAGAEERLGRWRDALRLSNYALTFTPGEPNLVRNKARLLHDHGDFARLDHDIFAVHKADTQRISKLTGRRNSAGDGMLTYMLERRRIDADKATRKDGGVSPFHGVRSQANLAYTRDWRSLESSKINLFAADAGGRATLGAGVQHEWRGDDRALRFGGVWREPAFALLEGVLDGGWRSRVYGEWEKRLSPRWSVSANAALNSYGKDGFDRQLASSVTLGGTLTYLLYATDPSIALVYGLDAEYVADSKYAVDPNGNPYHPMGVASREVHSLQAAFERALTDYLTWSLSAGYAWDRRSKGAPLAAVALRYEPLADLEIGLRASHARATARGEADAVDSAGGYLIWRY